MSTIVCMRTTRLARSHSSTGDLDGQGNDPTILQKIVGLEPSSLNKNNGNERKIVGRILKIVMGLQ